MKREQHRWAADLQRAHCLRRHLAAWRGHQQQVGADGEARLKAALLFSCLRSSGAAAAIMVSGCTRQAVRASVPLAVPANQYSQIWPLLLRYMPGSERLLLCCSASMPWTARTAPVARLRHETS